MVNKILITIACLLYPLNHFIAVMVYPMYETIEYDAYTELRYKLITAMVGCLAFAIAKSNLIGSILFGFCASDLISRFLFSENYFELKKDLFSILLVIAFEYYKYGVKRDSSKL